MQYCDPELMMEHAIKPSFWIMATFIIAFWFITVQWAEGAHNRDPWTYSGVRYLQWLRPYLTSHFRKSIALIAYFGILSVQLFEGWWVLQTNWRLLGAMLMLVQFPYMKHSMLGFFSWSMATGLVGVFAVFTLVAGWFIVVVQLSCIADILKMGSGEEGSKVEVSDNKRKEADL